jgi:hypothetical protein
MIKSAIVVAVLGLFVFLDMTCSGSTSPSSDTGATVISGTPITYSTIPGDSTGDTIVEISLQANRCTGNNLVSGTLDTSKSLYKFSGDSLLTTDASLTAAYFADAALRLVEIWYAFTGGTHSGSTISGTWTLVGAKGVPSQARTDSIIASRLPAVLARGITFSAAGTSIQPYSLVTFADDFITGWNTADSALYSIKVTKLAPSMVTLLGDTSGYTATVWEDAIGNVNYSNSYSEYGPYTYYADPTACPNNRYPVWWTQFLSANRR